MSDPRRAVVILGAISAVIYFVQGVGEPTDGLLAQPVQSILRGGGATPADLARFVAVASIPWSLKPLYGLLVDLVPIGRARWLAGATAIAGASTLALAAWPDPTQGALTVLVLVPTTAIAIADVAADAVMVERGTPLGATGSIQSVQWTAAYAASIVNGELGGRLIAAGRAELAFEICGALSIGSSVLVLIALRGAAATAVPERPRAREILAALRTPRLLGAIALLFLLAFSPFSSAIQYGYATTTLGITELEYGRSSSLGAIAAMIASALYATWCRKVSARGRAHGSVALAILSTLPFALVHDATSLWIASAIAMAAYATTSLVQMDLAAQSCPPALAGTTFATLMAVSNAGLAAGALAGASLWEHLEPAHGAHTTYVVLVLVSAATTALGWLAIPAILRGPPLE